MSRMSSRERLERKAAEAEVTAKERTERKATPTTTKSSTATTTKRSGSRKSSIASAVRQKVVWKVFNAGFKEVATFPHPAKAEADALAAKLTAESGTSHFVNAAKVPMEDA